MTGLPCRYRVVRICEAFQAVFCYRLSLFLDKEESDMYSIPQTLRVPRIVFAFHRQYNPCRLTERTFLSHNESSDNLKYCDSMGLKLNFVKDLETISIR